MKVLVACERSGVVRRAFRERGHEAFSCDVLNADDGGPFHLKCDVLDIINDDRWRWDLMIAHPPCTYISNMSNCRLREAGRREKRELGMEFFMRLTQTFIPRFAIENPRGLPERRYRKADQIIQPYEFGYPASKATCLWLKGLPPLKPTSMVAPFRKWDGKRFRTWVDKFGSGNQHLRSVTFCGVASAMADQWGCL